MHLKYFSRLHCGKGGVSGSNVVFCISRFTFYMLGSSVYFFLAKIYSYVADAFIEQLSISTFWELLILLHPVTVYTILRSTFC